MPLTSINPTTGATVAAYDEMTPEAIAAAVEQAHEAWLSWRRTAFDDRAVLMRRAGAILRERQADLAALMATEMGKPLAQGRMEAVKCALACDYYAEHAAAQLARDVIPTGAEASYVAFDPIGVVLAVMPWNFPLWQVYRFAAPALMAGNVGVLKHASNVTGCALAIERMFLDAGFPEGVFRTLVAGSPHVQSIIEDPLVRAVTLTGSTPAGRAVAAQAGGVLKKTVLELGGSDPYLVLDDADLDHAAETCVSARLINSGQSCIAAKRFIVLDAVREAFTERFVRVMRTRTVGDPFDPATHVGPLARRDLRDDLHAQVDASVAAGARLLLGGSIPDGAGAFYPPTVLTDVGPGMPAYDDELFGPVAAIIAATDEEDAIAIANDTGFGLGAAVFTRDLARGERVAARLEAGSTFVNAAVASDPRLPFGGVKASGYGRELGSYGIREFVNVRTVVVRKPAPAPPPAQAAE